MPELARQASRGLLLALILLAGAAHAQTPPLTIHYATTAGSQTVAILASWDPFPAASCSGTIAYDLWYSTSFAGQRTQATHLHPSGPLEAAIPVTLDTTFWIVRQTCIGQGYLGSTNVTVLCLSCLGVTTSQIDLRR